jgi:hypothetical protein
MDDTPATGQLTPPPPSEVGDKPAPAWMYNYFAGGRFYRDVDAAAAEQVIAMIPEIRHLARENRGFCRRAVERMAREGVGQFLDIGAGLPTQWSTHEIARAYAPETAVVYVDNDPSVISYSNEILRLDGVENVAYVHGDIRDPASILDNPAVREIIDFTRPVGQLHAAVWHFVPEDPLPLLRRFVDAVPAGSYLGLSHLTSEGWEEAKKQRLLEIYSRSTAQPVFRTRAETERLFDGLELLPAHEGATSGMSFVDFWGSVPPDEPEPKQTWLPCGVGRKP